MTEFEKWWGDKDPMLKEFAEKIWHAAQRAAVRTISEPPYIPKPGETIRFLGLCHPKSLGNPIEVIEVEEDTIKVYWVKTKHIRDGVELFSSGILSEVERVENV